MSQHVLADQRASGILMHITSLPGPYGIGDLGPIAYNFADHLADAGQSFWQILPLGPTGYADSPYACLSAFAGNPLLISLDKLKERGWLKHTDLDNPPSFEQVDTTREPHIHHIDYAGELIPWHAARLSLAYEQFVAAGTAEEREALARFRRENADWLEDFALYAAIKAAHELKSWRDWPDGLKLRHWQALAEARTAFKRQIDEVCFQQWVFREQWDALKQYVNGRGISFIGDIPFYVAEDSSDVWANPLLFDLDENGRPNHVAGVPPDFFSETGQLWGNPLYDWAAHKRTGYRWWLERIAAMLRTVDLLRIDHFRAFYNYWRVEANEAFWALPREQRTAKGGEWVDWGTPEERNVFFLARVPFADKTRLIAENLGAEMQPIDSWLDNVLELPGMQILQFAFGDDQATESRFWPERFDGQNHKFAVMYPGTHDNNTTLGWWRNVSGKDAGAGHKQQVRALVQEWQIAADPETEPHRALAELAMRSRTRVVILPMQDVLGLDERARMNLPDTLGWWRWRCTVADLESPVWASLRELTRQTGRERRATS